MSIGSLVARFGRRLWVQRPTVSVGADGEVARAYAAVCCVRGFVQPNTESSDVAQGRMSGRTGTTIYLEGKVDIRIDDEIRDALSGGRLWRVTGAVNPGDVGASQAAPHLSMTVVDATEVDQ